ncbi:MAG: acyltransferase [Planctomycetes bacterium]|nr:acyltransferase [Planctomycetota bacterium]
MPPSPVGSESTASRLSYRPALDGLRAIAVLSVFIFHLDPAVLPGGFVGVDIFFVLSGYLITRNIHRELEAGSFSLLHFYQRRIARIAPALFVLCISVLTVAAFLYTETDLATVGASVAATGASILNFKLIFQDNYFKLSSDTLPLLHCWSLSVEEQFYLCYPVLVWFIYRVRPSLLFPVVATLTVLSAAACIALTPLQPNYAFYLPMTRAWELGCGGLLALSGTRGGGGSSQRQFVFAVLGLTLVAISVTWTPGGRSFPGAWAFLPVAGVMLLLITQEQQAADKEPNAIIHFLSSPSLVGIGKTSYSLYLWHWPVFVFVDYVFFLGMPLARIALKVLLSIVFTWASYKLIEKPLRSRLAGQSTRRLAYTAFVGGLVVLIAAGVAVRQHYNLNATLADLRRGGTRYGGGANRPVMVLAGDSTACMFGTTVREVCREANATMVMAAVPGQNLLPAIPSRAGGELWTLTESILSRERPRWVVVSSRWTVVLATSEGRERLVYLVDGMLAHADRVIVLEQPPILPYEATREGMRHGSRPPFQEKPDDKARRHEANKTLRGLASRRVQVVNLDKYFLDSTQAIRLWDPQGNQLFVDRIHVSASGSKLVAAELLAAMRAEP